MNSTFKINNISHESLDAERNRTKRLITSTMKKTYLYEIGSTAIDGVISKQDLDYLVRVPLADFRSTRRVLDTAFTRTLANYLTMFIKATS